MSTQAQDHPSPECSCPLTSSVRSASRLLFGPASSPRSLRLLHTKTNLCRGTGDYGHPPPANALAVLSPPGKPWVPMPRLRLALPVVHSEVVKGGTDHDVVPCVSSGRQAARRKPGLRFLFPPRLANLSAQRPGLFVYSDGTAFCLFRAIPMPPHTTCSGVVLMLNTSHVSR